MIRSKYSTLIIGLTVVWIIMSFYLFSKLSQQPSPAAISDDLDDYAKRGFDPRHEAAAQTFDKSADTIIASNYENSEKLKNQLKPISVKPAVSLGQGVT